MPKNKKGGKNFKKGKKGGGTFVRQLIVADSDEQDYAIVRKMLGDSRILAFCDRDQKEKMCIIRGKMKKRVWIRKGDLILVSRRDFSTEGEKCDVIHKYSDDDFRKLRKMGEITNLKDETPTEEDGEEEEEEIQGGFDFDSDSEDSEKVVEEIDLDDL